MVGRGDVLRRQAGKTERDTTRSRDDMREMVVLPLVLGFEHQNQGLTGLGARQSLGR